MNETDLLILATELAQSDEALALSALSTEGQADRDAANLTAVKEWIH